MSDNAIQSYYASAEKTRHPLLYYQYPYMPHSSGANSNTARQEQSQFSSPLGHDTMNYPSLSEVDNTSYISGLPRGFREVESRSASLTTRSRNFSNYEPSSQGYPISDLSRPSGRVDFFKNDKETNDVQVVRSQLADARGDFPSVHPVTPLWTETSHSTAFQIQPRGFILGECIDEGGRSSVPSLVCRQEKVDRLRSMQAFRKNSRDADLTILEQGDGSRRSGAFDTDIKENHLSDAENLMGNIYPSTERTKSLETGPVHAVQPSITRRKKSRKMSDILKVHAVQPSITRRKKRRKMSDILNLSDNSPHEIVNKSFRHVRKGKGTKSELTFAGKEVIVLDSDDGADDGSTTVKIGGSSSKEPMEVNKRTDSDKSDKSPAEGVEKTEEITPHSWLRSWPLIPPTVQQTAQENPEQTVVYKPQSSYVAFEPIREREVPSTASMAVITSVFNKQINLCNKDNGSYKVQKK